MGTRNNNGRRRMLSRRDFIRLTSMGGGTILLAACGATPAAPTGSATQAPAAEGAEPTTAPAAGGGEQTVVTFWTPGGSQSFCANFATIAENFEAVHSNIDIAEVQCGTGEQAFNEVLLARIAAGNPPDATITWDSPIALGARGSLEPLDELMATSQYSAKENWPEPVLASCVFGGKTYGLPVAAGTYAMWYNQEWFERLGLSGERDAFPKTWNDMRQLSKEFTRWEGDNLVSVGFIPWGDQYTLPIWSASNGGQLYDAASRRYTIDSEQNIEMMQFALDWLNDEYRGDYQKLTQAGNWGMYASSELGDPGFQMGKVGMRLDGFWVAGDLYEVEPTFERWNVASVPIGPSGDRHTSGYWPNWLVIPTGSRNRDAAFTWLDYLSGVGIVQWFNVIPDMPTNKKVPTDIVPARAAEKRGESFALEVTDFFRKQLDVATPMWDSPIQNFANDQLGRALDRIYNKQATPQEALAEAQQACQAELEKVLQGAS
jgi:multiple sugar transport system substrate-binding protein